MSGRREYFDADHLRPALGDDYPGSLDLLNRWEVSPFGAGQLRQHILWNSAGCRHRFEPDRVAVARGPTELALIRVQVLHPQLGSVRMRRVGAYRLHVHTGKATF